MTDAADNTATQPTSAPRLSDFDGSRDNNFNLIRFLAATAVIFGHSYLIAWGDQQQYEEPIYKLTGWVSGHHAVDVFFATSGFLIMASLFRHPRVSYYIKARALRIYPALLVAVLFCAFIVGPMFTSKPMGEYFASKQVYKFVMANSMLEPFPIQYKLPGVFENAPYSTDDTNPPTGDLNGSLWTLPHEIKAYIGVGLFFFSFVLLQKREAPADRLLWADRAVYGVLRLPWLHDRRRSCTGSLPTLRLLPDRRMLLPATQAHPIAPAPRVRPPGRFADRVLFPAERHALEHGMARDHALHPVLPGVSTRRSLAAVQQAR